MLFKKIEDLLLEQTNIFVKECPTILLGLSGGPDSVFLFHFLKELHKKQKINLICAHLNHGWRTESDEDETFCKKLCATSDIELCVGHGKDFSDAIKPNGSKEEVGRKMRRHFFQEICGKEAIDFIALAHHQQDQQETFFMRLLRGTTLHGITAMKVLDGTYLRPLLHTSKKDILDHLHTHNIPYCIDETNLSDDFLRNRIRNDILPAFLKCDTRFDAKFTSTLKHLQEEDDFLQAMVKDAYAQIFASRKGNLSLFKSIPAVIQKRLIPFWLTIEQVAFSPSDRYIEEVIRFLTASQGGSHKLHESWSLHKKQNAFWIEKHNK
jgi:tRNA(Ile)-lysidine synthase